jgi:TonB-dependent starch-binding outer membrane protein SusC
MRLCPLLLGALWIAGGNTSLRAQQPVDTARGLDSTNHRRPTGFTVRGVLGAGDSLGSRSQVDAWQFNTGVIANPLSLIEDQVAGVQIIDNNEPGGVLSVRIRGQASVGLGSEPLYVLDGMPLGGGSGGGISAGRDPLNFLNPADIASITVLKDAASTAMYGGNGSGGVVLITTKSGAGRPLVEYGGSFSASSLTRMPAVLDAAQFRAAVNQYAPGRDTLLGSASTDWLSLVGQTGFGQAHNASLSGSGASNSYRVSLGYFDAGGILQNSSTQRIAVGANYGQRLFNDQLEVRLGLNGARAYDQFTPAGVLVNAIEMGPTQPVRDQSSATGYYNWPGNSITSADNPVEVLNSAIDHGTTYRGVGNIQATYRFSTGSALSGLAGTVQFGYDRTQADRVTFYPNDIHLETKTGNDGSYFDGRPSLTSTLLEGYLEYRTPAKIGPGRLDLLAGYSSSHSHGRDSTISANQLTTDTLGSGVPPSVLPPLVNLYVQTSTLTSLVGRVSYDVGDRYLAEASVRRDVSSRFAPGSQAATFPAFSVAWRISDEPFLREVSAISDLKVRASWGKTGNQSFSDYLSLFALSGCPISSSCPFPLGVVDPNIMWETTGSWDLGVDYGLLSDRLSGAIDWYTRRTDNLILTVPVPAGPSFSNYLTMNVGSLQNTGVELELTARLLGRARAGGPSWTASVSASHNTNRVLSLNPNLPGSAILTGNIAGGVGSTIQVIEPGEPINSFFVCQQVYGGGKPIEGEYKTLAGADTTGCNLGANARVYHDPAPHWIFGLTSKMTYHRFDLAFALRAWLGNYVYDNAASNLGNYRQLTAGSFPYNLSTSVLASGFQNQQLLSDYYVENGSFLRMDNITVGYTLPWQGERLRVYAVLQNAFTIAGYRGVDPSVGVNGIDNLTYPRSRIFTGGLTVQF